MTKAEKEHLDAIACLPCALCGESPVQIHHVREGQGMSQRASNWLTIPLCSLCHQGTAGVHGDRSMLRVMKKTELDLLADTYEKLAKDGFM